MTMGSLDGYSLNEKMDREFKQIKHEIEVLKFRIETEMKEIKERFANLSVKAQAKKSKKKVTSNIEMN